MRKIRIKRKAVRQQERTDLIPSGSTLLNLAQSGTPHGCWGRGKICNIVGDSHSGKTLLALTCLAEVANDSKFDEFKLIYDDVEHALEFDIRAMFGKKAAKRIQPPKGTKNSPVYSDTVQDLQVRLFRLTEETAPFIYVLDSLDALTSKQEQLKFEKTVKAEEKGKEAAGDYALSTPKMMSQLLRIMKAKLKTSDSLFMVISQTRDVINPISFIKKTRSGGRALKFYSSHIIWLANAGKIKKIVEEKSYTIGNNIKIESTKSKITGKVRTFPMRTYYDYGIDDIGCCVDWMCSMGFWGKRKNSLIVPSLPLRPATKIQLITQIELEQGMHSEMVKQVFLAWESIEEQLRLSNRERRFK